MTVDEPCPERGHPGPHRCRLEDLEREYGTLILHINREAIHHGAEVLLLRDLYRHQPS